MTHNLTSRTIYYTSAKMHRRGTWSMKLLLVVVFHHTLPLCFIITWNWSRVPKSTHLDKNPIQCSLKLSMWYLTSRSRQCSGFDPIEAAWLQSWTAHGTGHWMGLAKKDKVNLIPRRPGTSATEDNQGLSETCTASALGKAIVEGKTNFFVFV